MNRDVALWLKRKLIENKAAVEEMKAYDNMVNMKWELPSGLARLTYAVKFVHPIAHDAEKTACNFFDTYQPKIDILPRGPEDGPKAEELERFLEWHMMRANLHGDVEPFRRMLQHSVRYNRVCAQLDYLPYWLPKDKKLWTDEQREAMADSPFCITVHNPQNVHFEVGPYGLRKIALISNVPAADVIAHWKIYPGTKLEEIQKWVDLDPEARVILVDYTDLNMRYVAVLKMSTNVSPTSSPETMQLFDGKGNPMGLVVEVMTEKNKLGFIPWAVATGSSDALFSALHHGDLWVNANRSESIKRSDLFRRAFYPLGIETGQSTEDVQVDYSGDQPLYKVPLGKTLTPIVRPPIDPAWNELSAQDSAIMAQTTSVQTLSGIEPKSNVQFATINAFIQLSMTSLTPYIRNTEKAMVHLCSMVFKWLKVAKATEIGRRAYAGGEGKPQGQKIVVSPKSFDTESLFIQVKLIEDTPTGKLQLANMIAQLKQAGVPIPDDEFMERLGYGNPASLRDRFEKQEVRKMALANFGAAMQMQQQMQMQEAQMQMQMQAQQQMANSVPQPMIPGGQGNNPAAGGMPPAASAPELTSGQLPPNLGQPQ